MRRSGEERLRMACDMFDTARVLMRTHVAASGHAVDEAEVRVQIFLRTYGADFDADALARIVAGLRRSV